MLSYPRAWHHPLGKGPSDDIRNFSSLKGALLCLQEDVHLNSVQCKLDMKEGERKRRLNLQSHLSPYIPQKITNTKSQISECVHPHKNVRPSYEMPF